MLTLNDGRDELWQWDTGRTLIVDPDCSQVHFRKNVFDRSIDVDVVNGVAIIPDVLLQTDKDLIVWAFSGTAENGYTKIRKTFKVNRRNKPADYVFTPPDQTSLEEIKERVGYLESMQDPGAIKNAVEDYLERNPIEATVTAENIQSALGYTPADSEDVSAKLDKPATPPEVGKILKVTTVNNDGTFVCEWADAPSGGVVDDVQVNGTSVVADGVAKILLAKIGSTGVVKFDAFMPFTFNAGALRLANADENELTNPRYGFSTNRAITASNYRLAVKLAMCDGKGEPWTVEEQDGARERIAADGAWQCVTLTADDYDAENHRFLIDAGEGRQIAEVYGIGQVVTDTPADAALTVGIGFGNANKISYGVFGAYDIKATNTQTSFSFDGKSIDFTSVKSDAYSQFGTVRYNTSKSTTSSFYVDGDIRNDANVRSLIYWNYNNPRYFSIFGLWDNVTWAAIKIYIKLR